MLEWLLLVLASIVKLLSDVNVLSVRVSREIIWARGGASELMRETNMSRFVFFPVASMKTPALVLLTVPEICSCMAKL